MLALLLALSAPVAPAAPAEAVQPAAPAAVAPVEIVVDTVLPCGLRVLTARDMTLPVAAVILAIESGSEDDPPELPGLVHALAYQVEQGNRELRPGEAMATTQDAGGVYAMATGAGQVRYETVVPMSRLEAALWVESQRLRFPTVSLQRWRQTLGWAASDDRTSSRLRPEALAYVHGSAGLGHDGRATPKPLATVTEGVLAAQLASKFNYARATLIVVAPESPEALLARISPMFADLPPATRAAPTRVVGPRPGPNSAGVAGSTVAAAGAGAAAAAAKPDAAAEVGAAAAAKPDVAAGVGAAAAANPNWAEAATVPAMGGRTVPLSRQRGYTFVWPVPPTAAGSAWASAICRSINRQKKPPEPDEPRKARLTCDLEPDPRRGVMLLRPSGVDDPWALVRSRLARLGPGGPDAGLLQAQAAVVAQAIHLTTRTPQGLARLMAIGGPNMTGAASSFQHQHRVDELVGAASLADPAGRERAAPGLLRVEDAVVLTFPGEQP